MVMRVPCSELNRIYSPRDSPRYRRRAVALALMLLVSSCSRTPPKLPQFKIDLATYFERETSLELWIGMTGGERFDPGFVNIVNGDEIFFEGSFVSAILIDPEPTDRRQRTLYIRMRAKKTESEMLDLQMKIFRAGQNRLYSPVEGIIPVDWSRVKAGLHRAYESSGTQYLGFLDAPIDTPFGVLCVAVDFVGAGGIPVTVSYSISDCDRLP
jgi:hypothetical protein